MPSLHARFLLRRPDGFTLDAEVTLPPRGVTVLFGPSGSGKTSFLRCIAGLEHPDQALLRLGAECWHDTASGLRVPPHRRSLGYVFQEANLFPHLTAAQNLDYAEKRARPSDASASETHPRREALHELLGLDPALLRRTPERLSGGENQRVAIARALLARPRILLLDEPLAALDIPRKRELLPYLEKLPEALSIPILYVTHSPEELVRLADHIVLFEHGKIIRQGPLAEVLAHPDLPPHLGDELGCVLSGTVSAYDPDYHLLTLATPAGELRFNHAPLPVGRPLRVQIRARDLALSLAPPENASLLNALPATLLALQPAPAPGQLLARLTAGGQPLVARLSRYSCDRLHLAPDQTVHVLIKAVSILS